MMANDGVKAEGASSEAAGDLALRHAETFALLSQIRHVSRLGPVGCRPNRPKEERSRGV
jgi:hypothetical protein